MGATFSSIQIRSDSQEAVEEVLIGLLKEPAYVAPAIGGWVGVYPEGAEATDALAVGLSLRLTTAVFDWSVYDSDVFYYTLYENGQLRDEFNSAPDYFEGMLDEGDESERIDPARVQGDPKALLPYCVPGTTLATISEVLHPTETVRPTSENPVPLGLGRALEQWAQVLDKTPESLRQSVEQKMREKYLFADHQAADLARLLGLDEDLAQSRYSDIEQDDLEDYTQEDFRLLGNENLPQEYKDGKLWSSFRVESLEAAVKMGADVNARNKQGVPLIVALARSCAVEAIQFLVSMGADVNAAALYDAVEERSGYLLIGIGTSLEDGVTPLLIAAGASVEHPTHQLDTIRTLLNAGADVSARTVMGRTALGEALKMTDYTQHQGKIGRRAPEDVLRQAASRSAQVVEMLRAAGATE